MTRESSINWADAQAIKKQLIVEGWKTPDTYGNEFEPAKNFPAVYLFLLTNTDMFQDGLVAYVGMSKRLLSRWNSHNVLPVLNASQYWPQRWFKPVSVDLLRQVEAEYIQRFDPPWNVMGRRRGLVLQ